MPDMVLITKDKSYPFGEIFVDKEIMRKVEQIVNKYGHVDYLYPPYGTTTPEGLKEIEKETGFPEIVGFFYE